MFGLFKTDSEKLVNQCYQLNRELFASCRRYARKRDAASAKYLFSTAQNLESKLFKLEKVKGEEYAENILSNLISEDSLDLETQRIIFDVIIEIRMNMINSGKMREIKGEMLLNELVLTRQSEFDLG